MKVERAAGWILLGLAAYGAVQLLAGGAYFLLTRTLIASHGHGSALAIAVVVGHRCQQACAVFLEPMASVLRREESVQMAVQGVQVAQEAEPPQATLMTEGAALFKTNCAPCHGGNGQGGDGPKLAGNEFVKNQGGVITQILNGYEEHGMPSFRDVLKDREIAAIVNFVRNSFGNNGGPTTADTVRRTR